MKASEAAQGEEQAGARHVTHEWLDVRPVEHRGRALGVAAAARQQAGEAAAPGGVDPDEAPPAVDAPQRDVVGMDQPAPGDIDEPAVQDVLVQQHLTGPSLEALEVEGVARQLHTTRGESADAIDGHEQLASSDARLQPDDRGIARVREPDDQVVDASEPLTAAVDQRRVDDAGGAEEWPLDCGHGASRFYECANLTVIKDRLSPVSVAVTRRSMPDSDGVGASPAQWRGGARCRPGYHAATVTLWWPGSIDGGRDAPADR
jgi:hypothetical protein